MVARMTEEEFIERVSVGVTRTAEYDRLAKCFYTEDATASRIITVGRMLREMTALKNELARGEDR